jgi:hypothetical protein
MTVGPLPLWSFAVGVPHMATTCPDSFGSPRGVGHKPKSVAFMGRPDTASWHNGGPDGISTCLQVSAHSGEPFASIRARNLLSKELCRAALGDETVKSGPEVSFVDMALSLSSDRKRLTGWASGPDFLVFRPIGEVERIGPAADPGEEVAAPVASEIVSPNIDN